VGKSRDAFRTISEVSEWLDTPAHVLRFWESKFSQIKPVKRAGGRRYYRPEDVDLLAGIKSLLHKDGLTIKGAQKLLREQGVRHVAALGQELIDAGVAPEGSDIEASVPPEVEADVAAKVVPLMPPAMPPARATLAEVDSPATPAVPPAPQSAPTQSGHVAPRRHLFAAIAKADSGLLQRNAGRIRPLLGRLSEISAAARRD